MWRKSDDVKSAPHSSEPPPPVPVAERPPSAVAGESRVARTFLTHNIAVHGDLAGGEDVFLDGEFRGTVRVPEAGVTIGPNGHVRAEIEAAEIVVEGQVEGNLSARARVQIRPTGSVRGDIATPRLVIEEGALLCGRVEMPRAGEPLPARPAAASRTERKDALHGVGSEDRKQAER